MAMKIDEAIELLKDRKFGWHNQDCDCIFCEAINLAIKALEKQIAKEGIESNANTF